MQQLNANGLIDEFTNNYLEKLFYFCLKKTGNNEDAEDLVQDIAVNIIVSLNNMYGVLVPLIDATDITPS